MKWIFIFLMSVLPLSADAVLPPLYTSIDEITGMLKDPGLDKVAQSGEYIEEIVRTEEGFTIKTNKSTIHVKVETLPQNMPGPLHFQYTFSHYAEVNSKF